MHYVLEEASELLDRKSEDYNGTTDADPARAEYFPYGDTSYLHMLHTKFKRLEQVALNNSNPNFESARDSLLDLINYATFYVAFIDQKEKQDERPVRI